MINEFDYRKDKGVRNNFLRIGIRGLIRSLLSILIGVFMIYTVNIHGKFFMFYLFAGGLSVIMGIIGFIGSIHKYKELPEGIMCIYPGQQGWFHSGLSGLIFVIFFVMIFVSIVFEMDDYDWSAMLMIEGLPIILFVLSMIGLYYNRTHGLVVAEDSIYVIKGRKITEVEKKDIARIKSRPVSTKYKVYDHDGKLLFKFSGTWFNYLDFVKYMDENMRDKYDRS